MTMGIESLVTSDLRIQIGKLFGKDVLTEWLSGEVKARDIVEVVPE